MRKLPTQIAIPDSAADITAEVKRLLRAAGVKNQLPTPKSEILACAHLVETGELDLSEYEASFSEKARQFFHKAFSKVRGFLDTRSEITYVDPSLSDSKRLFVTYHEVSHGIIPWQHIICTEDDESTLSLECTNLFEAEANFGAAEILFQCERFEQEARDYELSVDSAVYLADNYEGSRHAAIRRFVERNHRPCLLLVLKRTCRENREGGTSFYVTYSISSKPFLAQFGDPLNLQFINPEHEVGRILNNGGQGEIALMDLKGFGKTCAVESFSNTYRLFVLVYPREVRHARRIIRFGKPTELGVTLG